MERSLQLQPKLMRRFYEVLVLLRVLSQVQGAKLCGDTLEEGGFDHLGAMEMRRKTMYHLCVMCDYLKGGDTVTAIASENIPCGPRYWIAANDHLEKIKCFLIEVLKMLETQVEMEAYNSELHVFEQRLFAKFVSFQKARIKQYWKLLQPHVETELKRIALSPEPRDNASEYREWLRAFKSPLTTLDSYSQFSQLAYDKRRSRFLRVAYDPITMEAVTMESGPRKDIRHYVGRLCAPRRAATLLTYAAANHPALFEGSSVQCHSSGSTSKPPAARGGLTLEGISARMFPNGSPALLEFRGALQSLDSKGSILARVLSQYQDQKWRPRVHAELALLEVLHERKCSFYDNDKYIACSKAACFCCYHYICGHQGTFTRPPSHNKIYLNWEPPDVRGQARYSEQRNIMNGLTVQVRQAVIEKVLNAHRSIKWHPDSSTGITPSVVFLSESEVSPDLARQSSSMSGSSRASSQGSQSSAGSESHESEDCEDGGVSLVQ
ncbi:hypothetical protein LTR37_001371 [Vermiconidia calcicola]|uniref:Uncharacterized protein n=1 Tax=Vermiconidia calcicola TaxID=1690605 RepID=A0ACC3NVV5_9PEZI|nr:hypothetical protein LTR37_001371 [Vermiconidia calcicola]